MAVSRMALARAAYLNGIAGIPSPLILLLEPSQRCNARCGFCYHWREGEQAGEGTELSLSEIERVLSEAWELGCRLLYLSGGEPTIYPELLPLLGEVRGAGFEVSMTTNGSRLAERMVELAPLLDAVTVSIDAMGEAHDRLRGFPGLFRRAVDGLAALAAHGLPARINMSLFPANELYVEPMLGLAREVGAGLHVRLLTRESSALEVRAFSKEEAQCAAQRLLELKARHPDVLLTPATYFRHVALARPFACRPLWLLVTVDSQGRVYVPCPRWEGTKDRLAGNVRERPLREIWDSAEAWGIRRDAAGCTPERGMGVDCYSSCILDTSLLAGLSGDLVVEQAAGRSSLLGYFLGDR